MIKLVFIGLSFLFSVSCAVISEKECVNANWFHKGASDAYNSKPQRSYGEYKQECLKYGINPHKKKYIKGYEKGLTKYCTYKRGLEVGQDGKKYSGACPDDKLANFMQGFQIGQKKYQLKLKAQELEEKEQELEEREEELKQREDNLED